MHAFMLIVSVNIQDQIFEQLYSIVGVIGNPVGSFSVKRNKYMYVISDNINIVFITKKNVHQAN